MLTLFYSASKDLSALDAPVDAASALYQRDLVRIMAEINFINGEVKPTNSFLKSFQLLAFCFCQALIHLLRSEGVEFGDQPIPPKDTRKRPKGFKAVKPEEDPDWIEYL